MILDATRGSVARFVNRESVHTAVQKVWLYTDASLYLIKTPAILTAEWRNGLWMENPEWLYLPGITA